MYCFMVTFVPVRGPREKLWKIGKLLLQVNCFKDTGASILGKLFYLLMVVIGLVGLANMVIYLYIYLYKLVLCFGT
jgi:hypothetical protein